MLLFSLKRMWYFYPKAGELRGEKSLESRECVSQPALSPPTVSSWHLNYLTFVSLPFSRCSCCFKTTAKGLRRRLSGEEHVRLF